MDKQLTTIVRFHAQEGREEDVAALLRGLFVPVRAEAGCASFEVFHATRDARLFFIVSRWRDEAAFEVHALLSHTVDFIARVEPLIDHPLVVVRTTAFE
jgi:quinol monooxygenase YgiN